jgi:hypothetical protein
MPPLSFIASFANYRFPRRRQSRKTFDTYATDKHGLPANRAASRKTKTRLLPD